MPAYFWYGLVVSALAIFLLWQAGVIDRKGWIIARATPLPIALVNPRDDVWISGRLDCPAPLTVPWFGNSCVYYVYREQERVQTRQGYRWRTIHTETLATSFQLVDRTGSIRITGTQAEFDGLEQCGPATEGFNRRYLASFFPYPGAADAVGSVSEDKRSLEPYGNIPLIVTARGRAAYLAARERKENWLRYSGGFSLLTGIFLVALGLSLKSGFLPVEPSLTADDVFPTPEAAHILLSLGSALAVFLLWWFLFTYNTLITYRERVKTAWRQIDVDLKNRYELIPALVTIVQAYAEHERTVAELLSRLRYDPATGIGVDRRQAAGISFTDIWGLQERYPELKANQLFAQLQNQLTALEEKIAYGRQFYNDSLLEYDNTRHKFPAVLVARLTGSFPDYEPFAL